MRSCACALLLAALAVCASAQEIRSYTKKELYPGQICADDGTPNWENKWVGSCPQGFNGIRKFAKTYGLIPGSTATQSLPKSADWTPMKVWPYCNACNNNQKCFEFKPGVAKCIVTATTSGQEFLAEGDKCLDFSNGNKKWKPADVNPVLFSKSCKWPEFSCNWDSKSNNGVYRCERIRTSGVAEPVKKCYRAAGSRWWGGSDQWYAWSNGKFVPCGGPNPDYKKCENFPSCASAAPWPYAE